MAELWEELNEAGAALDEMIDRLIDAEDDRREAAALVEAAERKADVRPPVQADPLTRDELADIRGAVLTQIAAGDGLASPAGLNAYAVADLLATIEHLQDAALDAGTERDMTLFRHRTVVPYQAEYLALVVECLAQAVEVPSAVVEPIPAPDGSLTLVLVQRGERFGWWVPKPGWDGWNIRGEFYRDPADAVEAAKVRSNTNG